MDKYSFKMLKRLQNGSDIRGVALQGVPGEEVNLTPEVATRLGRAFATWLKKYEPSAGKVAVGTDSRISGAALKKAFIAGHGLRTGLNPSHVYEHHTSGTRDKRGGYAYGQSPSF